MNCGECGTKNITGNKYCKECGAKLEAWHRPASLVPDDLTPIPDPVNRERLKKLLEMAFWHNQVGNLEGAVLACEAALVINPKSTTAHALLAAVYEKKGDDDRAIAELETVIEMNPDSEADKARLELLRRGVKVKAIEPPWWYRWLPPALAERDIPAPHEIGEGGSATGAGVPGKNGPRIAALAAALLVVALGVAALTPHGKPVPQLSSSQTQIATATAPIPPPTSAAPDSVPAPGINTQPDPNLVAPPQTTIVPGPDPFMKQLKARADAAFLKPPPDEAKPGTRTRVSGRIPNVLPPLGLRPLSVDGNSTVPPALINVPSDGSLPIPKHTVVVSQLGGDAQAAPDSGGGQVNVTAANNGDSTPPAPDTTASPGSHIHISVSDTPDTPAPAPSGNDGGQSSSSSPDGYQKTALLLQNQGNYKQARAAYEKAIHGYKTQIASGTNTESAERAIQACQIGLQICRQFQQ